MAATVNPADLLGLNNVGHVREGFRADTDVLDKDPIEDGTAWQNITTVIADGTIV